jgi:hypothetical protein
VIVGSFDRSFLCDMFSPGRMLISITCSRCELATIEYVFLHFVSLLGNCSSLSVYCADGLYTSTPVL